MPKQSSAAVQSTPKPKKKSDKMAEGSSESAPISSSSDSSNVNTSNRTLASDTMVSSSSDNKEQEPTSPKKDASTDPIELSDNLIKKDDLKDLLECPVCLRVPRSSPIFQCARGHVVCSECRPNVSTCPQCRDPLGNIRSLISEKMLEKLPSVCKYTDQGCQEEHTQKTILEHEKSCQYRLVNCVDLACQQRISVSKLLTHLDTDHETEDFVRVEGGEYSSHFIVNEEDFTRSIMWISDQLHFNDGYFYRECCRSKEGLWYIWVYVLESDTCKAVDYTCSISIKSADGMDELSCRCQPLSLDLTKEKIAESGRGLVFTDTTARLYWQDNKVRYKVVIQEKNQDSH